MNPQELIAEVFDHLRGMWRYRWWAAGIAWLISVIGWFYVYSMPDVYQASAKVFVDTNSLLRPLMRGLTAQQDPLNEVQLVSRAVLTRPNLEKVAHNSDLSLAARTPAQMEALVTRLQQSIQVSGGRDNIFTIQYADTSRQKSTDVVAAVLDTFVENALGNQGQDSEMTERALAGEIRSHEDRLLAAEAALAEFKKQNLGFMPGETGDYYDRLQSALASVNRREEEIRLLTQRRDELRRQIDGEEPVFGIMPMGSLGQSAGCSQSGQIAQIEGQLSTLSIQYTERHPRILALQETIATLEQACAEEREAAQLAGVATGPQPAQPLEANPVYQNLRLQLSNTEVDLVEQRSELRSAQNAVEQLRRDVDKIGQVETELKQLNRDYGVVQERHQQLLARWEDLQAKNRLDPVTDQVQFRRIEPPFALADPVGPNRPMLLAGAMMFALGAGIAVAFGLNQIHPAFFTRRSLGRAVDLPVLGSISMILTSADVRRRRSEAAAWAGAYMALLVGTAAVIAFAGPGSQLLRSVLERIAA